MQTNWSVLTICHFSETDKSKNDGPKVMNKSKNEKDPSKEKVRWETLTDVCHLLLSEPWTALNVLFWVCVRQVPLEYVVFSTNSAVKKTGLNTPYLA